MRLIIIGAGGYGQTVADVARQSVLFDQVLFLDDHALGEDVLGKCEDFLMFREEETMFYPAFGNNMLRLEWLDRLEANGCRVPVLIHDTAYVSPKAEICTGTVVLPKAVVNTGCVVSRGCIVNCGAIVDHGCVLEEGVHVCLGAIVKAENQISACSKIEAGQVIENRTYGVKKEKE